MPVVAKSTGERYQAQCERQEWRDPKPYHCKSCPERVRKDCLFSKHREQFFTERYYEENILKIRIGVV